MPFDWNQLAQAYAARSVIDPAYEHDERPTQAEYIEQARRNKRSDAEKAAETARSDALWANATSQQNERGAA